MSPRMNVELWVNKMPVKLNLLTPQGTGSYPPFEKGLHLRIRHIASMPPFRAPYFSTAFNPYWEQLGVYGHFVLFNGDKYFL